jgi:hypothetical protein
MNKIKFIVYSNMHINNVEKLSLALHQTNGSHHIQIVFSPFSIIYLSFYWLLSNFHTISHNKSKFVGLKSNNLDHIVNSHNKTISTINPNRTIESCNFNGISNFHIERDTHYINCIITLAFYYLSS